MPRRWLQGALSLSLVSLSWAHAGAEPVALRDCVQRALERNTALKLRRVAVVEAEVKLQEERGTLYLPRLSSDVTYRNEENASAFSYEAVAGQQPRWFYEMSYLSYRASLEGLIPVVTGTRYQLTLSSGITWTDLSAVTLSPRHVNTLQITLTQPLLRGWGRHSVVNRIEASRVDHGASVKDVEQEVSSLLLKVVQAYWQLVSRQQEETIAREALALTEKQRDVTRGRVQIGTLSPLDLSEAEAEVASRRQALVGASIARAGAEKALLLLLEQEGPLSAGEPPSISPVSGSRDRLVAVALRERPELQTLSLQLKAARLRHAAARNESLPRLDLQGSVGTTSLAGDADVDQTGVNPDLLGGHDLAYRQMLTGKLPFVQVGVTFEIPLSGAARRAEAERKRLAVKRLELQLGQTRARVALEVRDALARLRLAESRLTAAKNSVDLARANLELAEKKFKGGLGTTFDVLRAGTTLTTARRDLVAVRMERGLAHADLQAAIGGLPSHLGVDVR
jgi:outer membrane protein TolC